MTVQSKGNEIAEVSRVNPFECEKCGIQLEDDESIMCTECIEDE